MEKDTFSQSSLLFLGEQITGNFSFVDGSMCIWVAVYTLTGKHCCLKYCYCKAYSWDYRINSESCQIFFEDALHQKAVPAVLCNVYARTPICLVFCYRRPSCRAVVLKLLKSLLRCAVIGLLNTGAGRNNNRMLLFQVTGFIYADFLCPVF